MTDWYDHFRRNHAERPPIPWHLWASKGDVSPALCDALIASLQRFQVGESGDGKHLKRGAKSVGSVRYEETIARFIGEEQEHSRWLARLITMMNGKLLDGHWSDAIFVRLRRLCGLRVELMVLLVAEMIAMRYYRALLDGTHDPVLRAVFGQICHDEDGHVGFHIDFLSSVFARRSRVTCWTARLLWRCVFRAACLLVMWDHRNVLRLVGVTPGQFWRDTGAIFDRTANGIFNMPASVAAQATALWAEQTGARPLI